MDKNGFDCHGISAFIPLYDEQGGNSTKIIYNNGMDMICNKMIKSIITILARQFALDLTYVRKRYGSMICQRNIVPIPLSGAVTLVPFKLRKPLFIKDGSLGYVKLEDIEDITKDKEGKGIIVLKNQMKINCQDSHKSCQRHYNNGELIKYMRERDLGIYKRGEFTTSLASLSQAPATKEDIALLIREILVIREKLGS